MSAAECTQGWLWLRALVMEKGKKKKSQALLNTSFQENPITEGAFLLQLLRGPALSRSKLLTPFWMNLDKGLILNRDPPPSPTRTHHLKDQDMKSSRVMTTPPEGGGRPASRRGSS